ncbi:hypothetical protein Q0601_13765 [Paracoccus onubensis]|uniref:head-tail connector protein n=1 Tax=Paracoccus onubensis TaxID=1675788 RepID=UPI0027310166|nr:hypothetical protein [Paracoccus onubensis]MDP0928249.1 hypothetical protein [Paracoccus onubensis]
MLLREEAVVAAVDMLPVENLRAHLRLASGFGEVDDGAEATALAGFLRAAIASVEARTGKVLLRRRFVMRLDDWRDRMGQALPLAPVISVEGIWIEGPQEQAVEIPRAAWRLLPDNDRPVIRPAGVMLPHVPRLGSVVIRFTAGFGATWQEVPADLAQAVLMLAAQFYEDRGMTDRAAGLPFGVSALIERWRTVRTLAGRGARR